MAAEESPPTSGGSRDGGGCGDHDQPYRWGRPLLPMGTPWTRTRLLVLRGRIQDARAGSNPSVAADLVADRPQ